MSALGEIDRPFYGVQHDELQYQNLERLQEINDRVSSRFVPDTPLPPNFGFRPATTKYAVFPMLDSRMPAVVPIQANYADSGAFAPPVAGGPVAQYMRSVDVEIDLRNQTRALQKNVDAQAYVPSSASDLYRVAVPGGLGTGDNAKHPLLFQQFQFDSPANVLESNVGAALLHNSTRSQMRD